jgi:hypothetical protein
MKLHSVLILVGALAAFPATSSPARDRDSEEARLLKAEATVCKAFESGDAERLAKWLDPRFTLVGSDGRVTDLAANLTEVRAREPAYEEFRNHDQAVRLYDGAALINGITTIKGRAGGQAFEADFRYTDTWVQSGGHWRLAASHATRLATPSK